MKDTSRGFYIQAEHKHVVSYNNVLMYVHQWSVMWSTVTYATTNIQTDPRTPQYVIP